MQHLNEKVEFEYFASCLPGAEKLLADELKSLRVRRVRPLGGGVAFFGDAAAAMRVCLWSRLAARVLLVVGRVNSGDADLLYNGAYRIEWERIIASGASISVHAHGTNAELRNSKFTALKVKDALCDRMREKTGVRPDVNTHNPDVVVDVRVGETRATVSIDLSGDSLHKRSYLDERDGSDAPLCCAHAAALLAAAGWGEGALRDGALCAIPYWFMGGWAMAVSYWIAGIPYDLIHCVSNALLAYLLLMPLYRLCGKLLKNNR